MMATLPIKDAPPERRKPGRVMRLATSAKQELAQRKLAARKLTFFCQYVDPKAAEEYAAAHLQLLAEKLEAIERGEINRLMVFMPNRHWKSSLASQKFPAWFIGKRATEGRPHQVMIVSYGATLAEEISAVPRDIIRDNLRFSNVFPDVKIASDKQSSKSWGIKDTETEIDEPHPCCVAAGIGGGVTGKGADLLILDDPVKNAAEAESPSVQERNIKAWNNDLRTRLNPNAAVLLIMTRWSENDLAGKLLKAAQESEEADQWEVLVLPALAYTKAQRTEARRLGIPVSEHDPLGRQPGEALWPERYDEEYHHTTRANDELAFLSIAQQMPRRPGGYLVGRQHFKRLAMPPEEGLIKWVIPTDWAMTEKEQVPRGGNDPDYTAAGLMGLWYPDPKVPVNVNIIIAAVERWQLKIPDARRKVKQFALKVEKRLGMRPTIVAAQDNIDTIALDDMRGDPDLLLWTISNIHRRMMRGDKVVKSEAWRSRAVSGRAYIIDDGWWHRPWNEDFLLEVEGFPKAAHDDQVDMVSAGYHAFAVMRQKKEARSYQG